MLLEENLLLIIDIYLVLLLTELIWIMHYNYSDLEQATNGFDSRSVSKGGNKLGVGGFGPVYKGLLRYTDVAIKQLKPKDRSDSFMAMGKEQFVTEIEVLAQFRHPNLITLMGYSCDGPCPCLIYEFMDNGTLEDKLDPRVERKKLYWAMRLSIMNDAAKGIVYLHTADRLRPFIHRDIKSANVLLDSCMRAKVGDFGLVRSSAIESIQKTANIMGTSGYLAPEYLRGDITVKLDTYSFGVVMFEVLTGLAPYDPRRTEKRDLISYLEEKLDQPARLLQYVDKLLKEYPKEQALEFAKIAAACVELKASKRPTMEEVYGWLCRVPYAGTEEHLRSVQLAAGLDDVSKKIRNTDEVIRSTEKRREAAQHHLDWYANQRRLKQAVKPEAKITSLPGEFPQGKELLSLPITRRGAERRSRSRDDDGLQARGSILGPFPGNVISDGSSGSDKDSDALHPLRKLVEDTRAHDVDPAAYPHLQLDSKRT